MAKRVEVVITAKVKVNYDCCVYLFQFVAEKIEFTIGTYFKTVKTLPTLEHPQGEELLRKYTPIIPCSQTHTIDFLVKIYRPNAHLHFPLGGKYTPYLETQGVCDRLTIEGPFGRFGYKTGGIMTIDQVPLQPKRLFYMAGGNGITPSSRPSWRQPL